MQSSSINYAFGPAMLDTLLDSLHGPINAVQVIAGGTGYSNTDTITFTHNSDDPISGNTANATLITDSSGTIVDANITWSGDYTYPPTTTINTSTGVDGSVAATVDCDTWYVALGTTGSLSNTDLSWSVYAQQTYPNQQLIMGQRLAANSFANVVPANTWESGQVWNVYDDQDANLSSQLFFTVTGSGNVYKCIRNGGNTASTVEPANTTPTGFPEILSDGYQWLYMYSVPSAPAYSSAYNSLIPVFRNANVAANAIAGAVLNVVVAAGGSGYPSSNGTVLTATGGTGKSFILSQPGNPIPNYFAGCTLTCWNGSSPSNFVINTSTTSANGQLQVQLVSAPSANQVAAGFNYQIAPSVQLTGDGNGFVAHSVVGGVNSSILDVIVTNPGSGYSTAKATLISASGFGANAALRAIISPGAGHGTDPATELFAYAFGIVAVLANSTPEFATNNINSNLTWNTVSLIKNPKAFTANSLISNTAFTEAAFNQRVAFGMTGNGVFTVGESLTDPSTGSQMWVAAVNASAHQCEVVGLRTVPVTGSVLTGANSGVSLTLNSIGVANNEVEPDIQLGSSEILYLNNVGLTVQNSNTISPIIRIYIAP